jgi:prepilin-type processing-associated H-X9-DG protein
LCDYAGFLPVWYRPRNGGTYDQKLGKAALAEDKPISLMDITDGTSNTAILSEKYVNPKQYAGGQPHDMAWDKPGTNGYAYNSLWGSFNPDVSLRTQPLTVVGTNTRRNACAIGGSGLTLTEGIVSTDNGGPFRAPETVGTAHRGGFVPVAFADGSVTNRRVITAQQVLIDDGLPIQLNR